MAYFTHLHVHTEYSILDGASKIPKLVNKAVKDGMTAVAITDHGNMYGIKEFMNYVKKKNSPYNDEVKRLKKKIKEGDYPADVEGEANEEECQARIQENLSKRFKPIIGCEVYVARNGRLQKKGKEDESGNHLILLAKNENGYHNLIKMVSLGWMEGLYGKPRIDHELLQLYHEDIICASACLAGEVPSAIESGRLADAENTIKWYKELFGADYYLELQRHISDDPEMNERVFNRQQIVNTKLLEYARKYDIKLIATNDVHFVDEEDAEAHDRLLCINTGVSVTETKRLHYTKQEWFKSTAEMQQLFADVPEALANTMEIADKVEFFDIDKRPIMPDFPLPEGFNDNESYFRHLVWEGAKTHYQELTDEVKNRIEYEIGTICKMGFPGYFLIVQDFIAAARKMGVSVGPGRGSAAGSVVAYCLNITQVDPLKYDLLFERFLNPERISMPDIDIDFDDEGRGRVLEWVMDKYGKEKVAHIITFGTMAAKLAIRDVARVEDLPLSEANRLAKLIPDSLPEKNGKKTPVTISNCLEYVPEMAEASKSENRIEADTVKYASMLEGTIRQPGIHACGIIIAKSDLTDYIPVATVNDKKIQKRILVTQYEGSVIEEVGMLKMDFLGLSNLSIIKLTLDNIRQRHGIDINIDDIPLDDKKTYELFSRGDTVGTFQFESPGMRKYLRELEPSTFEDLIAMVALYRPGPMDKIPDFINRKHGKTPITYDIPVMEKYLNNTYGITVYQEQVMLLSQLLADFTGGQADTLRKAMGKKQIEKMLQLKEQFLVGCRKNGHDEKTVNQIWAEWEKFASYAFNKSHATCYALVSYRTAWLKANYPSEYMAALLTHNMDDITDLSKYMDETRRMGIQILPPDVNAGNLHFAVGKDGNLHFGLQGTKGIGEAVVRAIVSEREANGPYKDILDFVERVPTSACNKKCIESLAYAGAFDSLGIRREQLFVEVSPGYTYTDQILKYAARFQAEKMNNSGGGLFGDLIPIEIAKPEPQPAEPWSQTVKLDFEKQAIGIYLSDHPLNMYEFEIKQFTKVKVPELADVAKLEGRNITFAGFVTEVSEAVTKTGKPWAKITLEDFDGSHSIPFFGKNFEKFQGYLEVGKALWLRGELRQSFKDERIKELTITDIKYLGNVREDMLKKLTIRISLDQINERLIKDFKALMDKSKGNVPTHILVCDEKNNMSLDFIVRKYLTDVTDKFLKSLEDMALEYIIN